MRKRIHIIMFYIYLKKLYSFSGFIKGFHDKFNKDVVEATEWLLSTLIPKFSRGELTSLMSESRQQGILESFRLTETIHSRGINCRYLGIFYYL